MLTTPFFFGVFAIVFLGLYHLSNPRKGRADRDLRNTPLSFSIVLIATLFVVFTEGRTPAADGFERWLGYAGGFVMAGYLIRSYARLHARVRSSDPSDFNRAT